MFACISAGVRREGHFLPCAPQKDHVARADRGTFSAWEHPVYVSHIVSPGQASGEPTKYCADHGIASEGGLAAAASLLTGDAGGVQLRTRQVQRRREIRRPLRRPARTRQRLASQSWPRVLTLSRRVWRRREVWQLQTAHHLKQTGRRSAMACLRGTKRKLQRTLLWEHHPSALLVLQTRFPMERQG